MKKPVLEFIRHGLAAAAGGPVVLAIVYGILGAEGVIVTLTPWEACKGILSVTVLAFVAAGMSVVYTIERLPLISAVLIHAGVLYLDYLMIYLVNNWLTRDLRAIGGFTAAFAVGYAVIWIVVYLLIKAKTDRLNRKLSENKENGIL